MKPRYLSAPPGEEDMDNNDIDEGNKTTFAGALRSFGDGEGGGGDRGMEVLGLEVRATLLLLFGY